MNRAIVVNGRAANISERGQTVGVADAIRDTLVYRWVTPISGLSDGATDFTWPADTGTPSISAQYGLSYSENSIDGQYDGVSGDGSDDYGDTQSQLPNWTDNFISNDRALVVEFQSSSFNARNPFFGVHNTSTGSVLTFRPDNGEIQIRLRDDSGNEVIFETSAGPFDDGNYHVLILNKQGSDPANWDWYESAGGSATQLNSNIVSNASLGTFSTDLDFYTHARNDAGSPSTHQSIDLGQIALADSTLNSSERDNAPWR